jgi:hypothetical protein
MGHDMSSEHQELDELQTAYKAAVEAWIVAIRKEEALASANHSMIEIDQWEKAHLDEDDIRDTVKAAKAKYEDALRTKFFGF